MLYDKLIRDNIPEIIQHSGRRCEYIQMDELEYQQALLEKLVEEAAEVRSASREELATELADVLEVVQAIMAANSIEATEVEAIRLRRAEERGSFHKRLKLTLVE